MKIRLISLLSLLVVIALGAPLARGQNNTIQACRNTVNGQLRQVASPGDCKNNEVPVSWNIVGPQGPSGVSGLANVSCPVGQAVTGFNGTGQLICTPISSGGTGGGSGGGTGTLDTDGDGIPDAIDPCPTSPNFAYNGGSYCPASIYGVNQLTVPTGATVMFISVKVTAVSAGSMTVAVVDGDAGFDGLPYSSLTMNLGSLPAPPLNSRVNVLGLVIAGPSFAPAAITIVVGP